LNNLSSFRHYLTYVNYSFIWGEGGVHEVILAVSSLTKQVSDFTKEPGSIMHILLHETWIEFRVAG